MNWGLRVLSLSAARAPRPAQHSRSRAVQLGCDRGVATPKYVIVEESRRVWQRPRREVGRQSCATAFCTTDGARRFFLIR